MAQQPDAYHSALDQSILTKAMEMLLTPFRAGGYRLGRANDAIANAFANAMGAQRPDPNARANANIPGVDRSMAASEAAFRDIAENVTRAANASAGNIKQAGGMARSGLMGALGWQDAPATPMPAARGALPPPWDEDQPMVPGGAMPAPMPAPMAGPARAPGIPGAPMARRPAPVSPLAAARPLGPYPEDEARDMEGAGQMMGPVEAPVPTAQPSAAPAPRETLADQFRKRAAAMPQPDPGLSPDDAKKRAILQAGLAIMAAASRPGASALGAMGEGGLQGTAALHQFERERRADSRENRREGREDLRTEFTLADKDSDNARMDAAQKALDEYRQKTMQIEEQKLRGLMDDRAAKNALKEAELEMKARLQEAKQGTADAVAQARIAQMEAAATRAAAAAQDPIARAFGSLKRLFPNESNEQLWNRYKGGDKTGRTTLDDGDIANMYRDALKAAATNPLAEPPGTFEQFKGRIIGAAGGGAQKPSTEADAHRQANEAIKKGADRKAVNQRLQEWGFKPL
jgi:hypothetical protein